MTVKLYNKHDANFKAEIEASACYIENNNKLLILENAEHKSEANRWGVPAGKIETNESPLNAIIRETLEETSLNISKDHIKFIDTLYVDNGKFKYSYHMFYYDLKDHQAVKISDEHKSYKWVSFLELYTLPLMTGAVESLERYKKFKLQLTL